jgi:hypothetical protein
MTFLNDTPPAPPCPTSNDDPGERPPPPPPEMKSPAPAENEVPGSFKLQGNSSREVDGDQSKNGHFLATNVAMAVEATSSGEVSASSLPVGQPSYLTPMSQRSKPDYELPFDSNGLPYGPICVHHNADPADAEAWQDRLAYWKKHEAQPGEAATYEHAQTYRLDTWIKINVVRGKKDPAMPTFSNIAFEAIPYTLEGIDALRAKLNEDELDYIGTLTAVAETDPRYPAKTDCYCPKSGHYLRKVRLKWCKFNMSQYQTQLIAEGFDGGRSMKAQRGTEVSEILRKVTLTQVSSAGPWSGHSEGLHVASNGMSYLCTMDSPIPKLEHGDFAHLLSFLRKLFGEGVDPHYLTQMGLFLVWMQHAITALQRRDKECPSRLLVLTGEQSNGKSTLVNKIINSAFGGRAASAKLMISGKTGFNSELAEAELITFDDIPNNLSPSDTANTLKTFLVGHELGMLVHAKNQDAVTIPVLHRLVWCCNNDPSALSHLPKMRKGDGLIDKVITLRTHDTHLSGMSDDGVKAYRNKLTEQVPAFLAWLMSPAADEYVSGVSRDGRGPKAWMHPEIESELLDMSPEQHLLGMLRLGDEQNLWDARGNTSHSIDMTLSQLYRSRYEKLVGGNVVQLGIKLASLAGNGFIDKAHKSPNSKAANKWIVAGIARKLGADE